MAKTLYIIFEKPWQSGEVSLTKKGEAKALIFKRGKKEDLGNYRTVSLPLVPVKVMEQILLKTMLRHMETREVMDESQPGFTKGRLCLTEFVTTYSRVPALVG